MKHPFMFHARMSKASGPNQTVKGFCSLNNVDREGANISPEAFDLVGFLNNPQLLYNHKFWKDGSGNEINIGQVEFASVGVVRALNDNEWSVTDENGNEFETLEKSAHPDLRDGLRGLFVKAKVTVPDVWNLVENGDLNTFSWKGLATLGRTVAGGVEHVITKLIDMVEVSLVFKPANMSATFEIAKGIEFGSDCIDLSNMNDTEKQFARQMETLSVQRLEFTGELFDQSGVETWLKDHQFSQTPLTESNNGQIVSEQLSPDIFEASMMFSFEFATGVQVIVGRMVEAEAQKLLSDSTFSELTKLFGGNTVLVNSSENEPEDAQMPKAKKKDEKVVVKNDEENADAEAGEAAAASTPNSADGEAAAAEGAADAAPEESADAGDATADADAAEGAASDGAADEASTEKGVAEEIEAIDEQKWTKLGPIFKTLRAFDEAVYMAPNDNAELKTLVDELASILTDTAAETLKALDDHQTQLTLVDQIASEVSKRLTDSQPGMGELLASLDTLNKTLTKSEGEASADGSGATDAEGDSIGESAETETDMDSGETETQKGEGNSGDAAADAGEGTELVTVVEKQFQDLRAEQKKDFGNAIRSLSDGLNLIADRQKTMEKSAISSDPDRDEKVMLEKGEGEGNDDLNGMFSPQWPFAGAKTPQ